MSALKHKWKKQSWGLSLRSASRYVTVTLPFITHAVRLLTEPHYFTMNRRCTGMPLKPPLAHTGHLVSHCHADFRNNSWVTREPAQQTIKAAGRQRTLFLHTSLGSQNTLCQTWAHFSRPAPAMLFIVDWLLGQSCWANWDVYTYSCQEKLCTVTEIRGTENPLGTNDYIYRSKAQMIRIYEKSCKLNGFNEFKWILQTLIPRAPGTLWTGKLLHKGLRYVTLQAWETAE